MAQKWEYHIEGFTAITELSQIEARLKKIQATLNGLGADEWEAVTSIPGVMPGEVFVLFKRSADELKSAFRPPDRSQR